MSERTRTRHLEKARRREREELNKDWDTGEGTEKCNYSQYLGMSVTEQDNYWSRFRGKRNPDYESTDAEHRDNERSLRKSTVAIADLTGVLALVGIVSAIFSALQWRAISGQLDEMRAEQRAWISVAQKNIAVEPSNAPTADLSFVNSGHSPALHIVAHLYVEIVPNGNVPHFESQTMHTISLTGVMMPNLPEDVTAVRRRANVNNPKKVEDAPVTADEFKALNNGDDWIAVHGIIYYDDASSYRHWRRFCFHASIKPGMYQDRICTAYNAVGDGAAAPANSN